MRTIQKPYPVRERIGVFFDATLQSIRRNFFCMEHRHRYTLDGLDEVALVGLLKPDLPEKLRHKYVKRLYEHGAVREATTLLDRCDIEKDPIEIAYLEKTLCKWDHPSSLSWSLQLGRITTEAGQVMAAKRIAAEGKHGAVWYAFFEAHELCKEAKAILDARLEKDMEGLKDAA